MFVPFFCLPKFSSKFWREAVITVISLINKILSSNTSGSSTFKTLFGHPLDYSSLRVFGCTCIVLRPESNVVSWRLALLYEVSWFMGKAKRLSLLWSHYSKIYVSCHVVFLEHILFFFISDNIHNVIKTNLIHIDPFSDNINRPFFLYLMYCWFFMYYMYTCANSWYPFSYCLPSTAWDRQSSSCFLPSSISL